MGAAGDDVYGACGKIAGFEELVEVGGDERVEFAGDGDDSVAHGKGGHGRGEETEERSFGGAEDADGADGFLHGQGDVAEWGVVDGAFVFVGPGGVCEGACDAGGDFGFGLIFAYCVGEATRDFIAALGEVFGNVVEDLGAGVGGGLGPGGGFAGGFDGVADVFAIACGGFAEEPAVGGADWRAVAGVGAGLFAGDEELYGAVDWRSEGRSLRGGVDASPF